MSGARRLGALTGAFSLLACLLVLTALSSPSSAATADIGYRGPSFTGVSNPPTADKPQSKLWYNDGSWWAVMFSTSSSAWRIFVLDRATQQWNDTGVAADDRKQTLSDVLWDGSKLYIASNWVTASSESTPRPSLSGKPARLYRYSYDATQRTYRLDAGFPTSINNNSSESLTIDKDTTGRLWATWTQVSGSSSAGYTSKVYVNSTADGTTWSGAAPVPVPDATLAPDDISAVVAFSRARIGVLWSNQLDGSIRWAVHKDGDPVSSWKDSVAVRGNKLSDDHLNLKTLQSDDQGRVYAVIKTSLDEAGLPSSAAQIMLLVFRPGTGNWTSSTVATIADCHTRPQLVIDETNALVHVFATGPTSSGCPYAGAPGTIYEKVASMEDPVFPAGRGTPVIRDGASANMNNVTTSKQSVTAATGLVVLASNTSTDRYWHADLTVPAGSASPTPTATATATSPAPTPTTESPSPTPTTTSPAPTPTTESPSPTPTTTSPAPTPVQVARQSESTVENKTATSTVTLPLPAGSASGDVLVACLALNGGHVSTVPAGWTEIGRATTLSNPKVYGYARVVEPNEPSTYSWDLGRAVANSGGIARYSHASAVLDGVASAGDSSKTAVLDGVTSPQEGAALVGCVGINSSAGSIDIIPAPGMSEAWDLGGKRHDFADQPVGAGPTGTRTWSLTSGRDWAGWLSIVLPG